MLLPSIAPRLGPSARGVWGWRCRCREVRGPGCGARVQVRGEQVLGLYMRGPGVWNCVWVGVAAAVGTGYEGRVDLELLGAGWAERLG